MAVAFRLSSSTPRSPAPAPSPAPEWSACFEALCADLTAAAGNDRAAAAAMDRLIMAFIGGSRREWRQAVLAIERCVAAAGPGTDAAARERLSGFVRENADLLPQ